MGVLKVNIVVSLILVLGSAYAQLPDCPDQGLAFTKEPSDREINCGQDEVAIFYCEYKGHSSQNVRLQWIINSKPHNSNNLPPGHSYNNHRLTVTDIALRQNNTLYQCQLVHPMSKDGPLCSHKSLVGQLIINCGVPDVHILPYYNFESHTLKRILTKIFQVDNVIQSYTIVYADSLGQTCDSDTIVAFSCQNRVCIHELNIMSSQCPICQDIAVTVTTTNNKNISYSLPEPIRIDAVNKFAKVMFDKVKPGIMITFINEHKENDKFYEVNYGPVTPGCKYMPFKMKGYVSNSNSISIELNISKNDVDICFFATLSNGINSIFIEGYNDTSDNEMCSNVTVPPMLFSILIYLVLFGAPVIIVVKFRSSASNTKKFSAKKGELTRQASSVFDLSKNKVKPIDLSTTFYKWWDVREECFMHDFASKKLGEEVKHLEYKPEDGYGYYKVTKEELDRIPLHKKVILMDKDNCLRPRFSSYCSVIKKKEIGLSWSDVYVQDRSYHRELKPGTAVLYCARSKIMHAYTQQYPVTEKCYEDDFVRNTIPRYRMEWIRYCYFEFKKLEYIRTNQRVIVLKKDGEFVTGPGVQHLVGIMSDLQQTQPPIMSNHKEWECVFVQSREIKRELTQGSKYLFCVQMDQVRIPENYYTEYDIEEDCLMKEFGSKHIPSFKLEFGYGYYEFKQAELIKPHKKVILKDKENQLYTGTGAQLFCTSGNHNIFGKGKATPPNLKTTVWTHIFIQSHSKKRKLPRGTKFLHCVYKTYK